MMQIDAEQIVAVLLQHPNEIVRMATENVILQAQVAMLTGGIGDDTGLADPNESGSPAEPEREDA